MKGKKELFIFALSALIAGLLPTTAFATGTDTGKAIQLADSGTAANIGGGQADNIYFGNYFQSNSTTKEPVKWRVLSNADGKLFLLSDQNLDAKPYNSSSTSITWEKSTIRSWLNGYEASENNSGTDYSSNNFINAAFSSGEQIAIADTYVYNKTQSDKTSDPNPTYSTSGGEDTNDQIFLLSIEEALNTGYGFSNRDSETNAASGRVALNTAYAKEQGAYTYSSTGAGDWWLRSPGLTGTDAAIVHYGGYLHSYGFTVDDDYVGVRPAFNLNLNSVLFTSAAAGGKSATGMDSGLTAVGDAGSEWKLTLLDSSRSFTASTSSATTQTQGYSKWTVEVTYSGAQTGSNEYVSAMLVDGNGSVLYYGRVANNSANGTASITIPDGLAAGNYTLKVFNEQYNGDKTTDYASALCEVQFDTTVPTALDGTVASAFRARAEDGAIRIINAASVQVFDAAGRLVYAGQARRVVVPQGMYIVRSGKDVQKVAVK